MKIRVRIINQDCDEGVHELANINGEIIWVYSSQEEQIMQSPTLRFRQRGYIDRIELVEFALPFFKEDLENIEWT